MKTFNIATIIAAMASLTWAAPAPAPAPEAEPEPASLGRRASTNVYLCKDSNFGTCTTLVVNIGGGCYDFPSDYNDKVSSLKTGGPSTTCYFYTNGGCSGDVFVTKGPSSQLPANYNDDLSSVHC